MSEDKVKHKVKIFNIKNKAEAKTINIGTAGWPRVFIDSTVNEEYVSGCGCDSCREYRRLYHGVF